MAALLAAFFVASAGISSAADVSIIAGSKEAGLFCTAVIAPDAATPGQRPLRFRLLSRDGGDLALGSTAIAADSAIDLVAGDMRVPLEPYRLRDLESLAAHPVWSQLETAERFHLTEFGPEGLVRTARFDGIDMAALRQQMAQDCGLVLPEATAESAVPLTEAARRLLNYAAFRIAGTPRGIEVVTAETGGAAEDRRVRALQALGAPPSRTLTPEVASTLAAAMGVAVLPRFEALGGVQNGRAPARQDGVWGIVDTSGAWLTRPVFRAAGPLTAGRLPVALGGFWAVLGPDGRRIPRLRFDRLLTCGGDLCAVEVKGAIRILDFASEALLRDEYQRLGGVSATGATVEGPRGWELLDPTGGGRAGPVRIAELGPPQSGLVPLRPNARGGWQLANAQLQPICAETFDAIGGIGSGLVSVSKGALWGAVDMRRCGAVVRPAFAALGRFSRGLAPATADGTLWGFIDKSGAWAVPPRFQQAAAFEQGFARVTLPGGKVGFIDTRGGFAVPPIFDAASDFQDGFAAVQLDAAWGLLSRDLVRAAAR